MNPIDRLKIVMKKRHIKSRVALANIIMESKDTVQSAFKRDSLSENLCQAISSKLGIDYDWLAFGIGKMEPGEPEQGLVCVDAPAEMYAYLKKAMPRLTRKNEIVYDLTYDDFFYVFQLNWLRRVASKTDNCFMLEICGDSMRPELESGDLVLVDKGRCDVSQSGLFAFGENGVINIKELVREGHQLRIVSMNKTNNYPDRLVNMEDIVVLGKVIWLGRELK